MKGRLLAVATIALVDLACRDQAAVPPDAGSDVKSDVSVPLTLDIAVTGCASYDPAAVLCTGRPPLMLSFAPVGSPVLTQFLWTFGDGTPTTTERAPSHTYPHPDDYQVTLVGGTGATSMVMPSRPLTVRVLPLGAGAPCDVDFQCDDAAGLTCVCAPGNGCPSTFVRGVCSVICEATACGTGAVCAIVAVAPQADAGARSPLCLAACEKSTQCPPSFVCETVPAGPTGAAARWTRACLPLGFARALGASCRDASEALTDDACASGSCADVGALGVCSAGCDDARPCPDESACARLADGRQLCLPSCTSDGDCAGDPLLACVPLPAAGSGGPDVSVCAPRSCANDGACPSGRCGPNSVCVR